jgi:diguanylate cyclase (GGDEF)-like protein
VAARLRAARRPAQADAAHRPHRTDPLTGLHNRRSLDAALADEWERLQRGNDGSLSMLFIDADHFKQYNDRYGHAQGDTALRFLAECIRAHTRRRGDLAARYGGEEFVAVLPDTDESGAATVAEAIRGAVERNCLDGFDATMPAFTVSIGCATAHRGHRSPCRRCRITRTSRSTRRSARPQSRVPRGREIVCATGLTVPLRSFV